MIFSDFRTFIAQSRHIAYTWDVGCNFTRPAFLIQPPKLYTMRHIIFLLTVSLFLMSCGQTDNKQKELELKEKELALKEKELEIKQKELNVNLDTSKVKKDTPKQTAVLESTKSIVPNTQTTDIPFVGKKNWDSSVYASIGQTTDIPFVGKKNIYEFWLVGEGGGRNYMYSIEIKSNGDVYLTKSVVVSYSEDVLSKKQKFVGKYQPILKGIGEFSPNEYYKITKTKFSIVDEQGNLLKLSGCCNQHSIAENSIAEPGKIFECACEEQYY